MTTYPVRIIQVFRVEREIVVDVIAGSQEEAVDQLEQSDDPLFDDPRWKTEWTLENEVVKVADGAERA